jgi:integrase
MQQPPHHHHHNNQQKQRLDVLPLPPLLDSQIDEITKGLSPFFNKNIRMLSVDNIKVVISYIKAINTEIHLSISYKKSIINFLTRFAGYHKNKPFKNVTRDDVISFLDSLRKLDEEDPMHKWVGTYNIYLIYSIRFFKWLYEPDIEPSKRLKPAVVQNIPQLKRREISHYKPSDLWTPQDDLLFLKYCPSMRERCYHAISRDLAARPHEILNLKIKDIAFKTVNGHVYVECVVNGKTGTRPLVLINSIPYLKDYLDHEHPMPNNPNSPLICGTRKCFGKHLSPMNMTKIYEKYKRLIFPKLLDNPNVTPEDKQLIRELLR